MGRIKVLYAGQVTVSMGLVGAARGVALVSRQAPMRPTGTACSLQSSGSWWLQRRYRRLESGNRMLQVPH